MRNRLVTGMNNFYGPFFKGCRWIVRRVYPKYHTRFIKPIDSPVVYVSHHQNMFGPFITLLWFPESLRCWILHVFMDKKSCYRHYADYTFSERYKWSKGLSKIVAFVASRFIPPLLNSGKGIPVYRGSRQILKTFRESTEALKNGESIVIFPDVEYSDDSPEVKDLYEGFLYIEKYYYRETGKHISFVPLYASKKGKTITVGEPIQFRDDKDFAEEKDYVLKEIQTRLNELAKASGDL